MRRAGAVLRAAAAEARVAVAARRDGAGDDALALAVALHGATELLDDADRFVANGQARRDRILALQDVDVGAADRRGGDADERVERADIGHRLLASTIRPFSTKTAACMVRGMAFSSLGGNTASLRQGCLA